MAGRLAVEHRVLKALEIVLGKFAQIEGDAAGIDHVAAVAAHAEIAVDVSPEVGIIRLRAGAQSSPNARAPGTPGATHDFDAARAAQAAR